MADFTRQGVRNLNNLPGRGAVPDRRRTKGIIWHSCTADAAPYTCDACRYSISVYDPDACRCGTVCRTCGTVSR